MRRRRGLWWRLIELSYNHGQVRAASIFVQLRLVLNASNEGFTWWNGKLGLSVNIHVGGQEESASFGDADPPAKRCGAHCHVTTRRIKKI